LILRQERVRNVVNGKESKPTTETSRKETSAYWERHDVAWSTILLAIKDRIQAKYATVEDVEELWQKLKDDNTEKIKLDLWSLRSELYAVQLGDYGTVDAYAARIAKLIEDFNLAAVDGSKDVTIRASFLFDEWHTVG